MKNALLIAATAALALPAGLAAQATEIDSAALWRQHCQRCHGADGAGQTAMGRRLQLKDYRDPAVQDAMTDEEIVAATRDGVTKDGRQTMPGYSDKLSEEEIQALLAYVRAFRADP